MRRRARNLHITRLIRRAPDRHRGHLASIFIE
jgi:hypothetical protein